MANEQGTGQDNTGAGESQAGTGQPGAGQGQQGTQGAQGAQGAQGDQGQQGQQGQQGTDGGKNQGAQGTPLDGYQFKAVDGVELDKGALDAFLPVAKELGLTAEQAQKLVDLQSGFVKQQAQGYIDQQAKWVEDIKNDPEFGGAKFDETIRLGKAAVEFAGPEFKDFLNASGMGNNPFVVKALAKFGTKFATDKVVGGESRNPGGETKAEDVFFPSMKK